MKNILALAAALALCTLSTEALAGQPFVRAEAGNSDIEVSYGRYFRGSDNDTALLVGGGYWFTPNLAVAAQVLAVHRVPGPRLRPGPGHRRRRHRRQEALRPAGNRLLRRRPRRPGARHPAAARGPLRHRRRRELDQAVLRHQCRLLLQPPLGPGPELRPPPRRIQRRQ